MITPTQFHGADGTEDWRVVGDGACAFFRTTSLAASAALATRIGQLAGVDDQPPDLDFRPDGVTVRLVTSTPDHFGLTDRDLERARRISEMAAELGLTPDPSAVQSVLVIVGALVPDKVMPFWRALLGYEPRPDSPDEDLIDPRGRGPAFWFETMDDAPERRIGLHVAVWVPPEQAEARVAAALAAGGRIVRDVGPAWWTLADAEGNEADVATTQSRD